MPIPYFAEHQNDVFLPALVTALVATVLLTAPVIAAPLLARMRARRALLTAALVLGAAAVVLAAVQVGAGLQTRDAQRLRVQHELADRYGLQLRGDEVSALLEGATVRVTEQGAPTKVKLTPVGGDDYALTAADGTRLPTG